MGQTRRSIPYNLHHKDRAGGLPDHPGLAAARAERSGTEIRLIHHNATAENSGQIHQKVSHLRSFDCKTWLLQSPKRQNHDQTSRREQGIGTHAPILAAARLSGVHSAQAE
jgi:hypothetical protein